LESKSSRCYGKSHTIWDNSVTCHQTAVTFPPLPQLKLVLDIDSELYSFSVLISLLMCYGVCVFIRRLRHQNILLLLGVCQTDLLDGLVLIYERIGLGSLHNYLYHTVVTFYAALFACICTIISVWSRDLF